jgi:hypothetical protein
VTLLPIDSINGGKESLFLKALWALQVHPKTLSEY